MITNNLICTPLSNTLDHWVGMNHQKWNWDQKAFSLSHTAILSSREMYGLTNPAHPTILPWGLLFHTQMSTIFSPRSLESETWVLYLPGTGPAMWLQAHHSTSPAPVFSSVKWEWIAHIAFSLLYTLPFHAFHNLPTLPIRKEGSVHAFGLCSSRHPADPHTVLFESIWKTTALKSVLQKFHAP